MIPYVRLDEVIKESGKHTGYVLLDERHGCVNGCNCGVSIYVKDKYGVPQSHDDQEGFFVLEGYGKALIDGEELDLEPGMCFVVPAHVPHIMKRNEDCPFCKVFWFHAAV